MRDLLILHACLIFGLFLGSPLIKRLDHAYDWSMYDRLPTRLEKVCRLLHRPGAIYTVTPVAALVAAYLAWRRRPIRVVAMGVFFGGCMALGFILKRLFHRKPPLNMEDYPPLSFPSGHTLLATGVYGMSVYLLWDVVAPRWRLRLTVLAVALVVSTALGLLLPGYHYLSDVVAGYAVAVMWILACVWGLRRIETSHSEPRALATGQLTGR